MDHIKLSKIGSIFITKQHRAINVRWLKLYEEPEALFPNEPPRNEREAATRTAEITVIAMSGRNHVTFTAGGIELRCVVGSMMVGI